MIHASAVVDPNARIHETCKVGAFAVIGADVVMGAGNIVGPNAVIEGPTTIGENNHIFQFASIGADPQDLKFDGLNSRLEIGSRNRIREFVTVNRGTDGGGGVTRIGDENLLMAYVHIAHDCLVDNNAVFANSASLAGHVTVGDHAILGGFSLVHQFSRIGAHSFSGMGSVINKDVPPYVLVAGHFAESKGINKEGLKRRGFSPEEIRAIQKSYMKLVRRKGVIEEEVFAEVEQLAREHKAVANMLEFVRTATRGTVS